MAGDYPILRFLSSVVFRLLIFATFANQRT
jgi:hypothetical protein